MNTSLNASLRRTAALAVTLTLSACASHPFVSWDEPVRPANDPIPLTSAITYADSARQKYEQALIAEVKRRMDLSNGLIVLGAVTIGLVAGDARRGWVLGSAMAGGTAYTLGTWNSSDPREQIYLEGAKAMICAKDAMLPLSASTTQLMAFDQRLTALSAQITKVNNDLGTLKSLLPTSGADTQLLEAAQTATMAASDLLKTARKTLGAGDNLRTQRAQAGEKLVSGVQSIRNLVDNALKKTIPSLSALPGVISGLAKQANIFVPGAGDALAGNLTAFGKPPVGAPGQQQSAGADVIAKALAAANNALRNALANLNRSSLELESEVSRVTAEVNAVNAARSIEKLKSCGIDADTDMHISRDRVTLTEKDTSTEYVRVTGGKKPYTARVSRKPAQIDVHSPFSGDSTVEIVGTDKTAAGMIFNVDIEDAAGNIKSVTVTITGKPAAGDEKAKADTVQKVSRSKADITAIQQSVCAPVTGTFNAATTLAVQIYKAETGSPAADGTINADQFAKLKQENSDSKKCAKDRLNYYEKTLTEEDIKAIKKLLKPAQPLDATNGTIDKEMRDAIVKESVAVDFVKDEERKRIALKAKHAGQLTSALRTYLVNRK